jgi:catechol 2,3-dioxygenase-like lactoylglutathione lyase family enzyme
VKRLVVALILLASVKATNAQQPPAPTTAPPSGLVVGSGNYFSPIVADLDKAVAFYRDGLGLEPQGAPANADGNAPLRAMFGLPDAALRWQVVRTPAVAGGVEIVEIAKANGKSVLRRVQDSGAITLVATVRDVDATFARVKRLGAPVVTRSGAPVRLSIGPQQARMVVVQDPAGHFVEIVQPDTLPDVAAGSTANVVGVRIRFTVSDVERAVRLYRDALGFRLLDPVGDYNGDVKVMDVLGLTGGQFRVGALEVPGSGLQFTLIDFKGVDRQTRSAGIQDPGSTRLQLRVADVEAAGAAIVKAGGAFISTGGKPVALPAGATPLKAGIVRDPDGLFLVLIEAPPQRR